MSGIKFERLPQYPLVLTGDFDWIELGLPPVFFLADKAKCIFIYSTLFSWRMGLKKWSHYSE